MLGLPSIGISSTLTRILVIAIIALILTLLISSWISKHNEKAGEKVLSESAIEQGHTPKEAPTKNKYKTNTLGGGKSIDVASRIKDAIHTFSSDDVIKILTTLKENVKTKTDLSMVVGQLNLFDIKFYDVMNKDLDSEQKKTFAKWIKDLPEYIYY